MKMRSWILLLVGISTVGCAPTYQTRTYDVNVRNDCTDPVTVWLTKDGPPYESGWLAPEDIAVESPKAPTHIISGLVIPPGKTGFTGPRKGQFEPQGSAVLRIYGGQLDFNQLLASGQDDKNRIDWKLHPGTNDLVVSGPKDAIEVNEDNTASSPSPSGSGRGPG